MIASDTFDTRGPPPVGGGVKVVSFMQMIYSIRLAPLQFSETKSRRVKTPTINTINSSARLFEVKREWMFTTAYKSSGCEYSAAWR
jgi:hypothetical protein